MLLDCGLSQLKHICWRPRQPGFVIIHANKDVGISLLPLLLSSASPPPHPHPFLLCSCFSTPSTRRTRDGKRAESRSCGGGPSTCFVLYSSLLFRFTLNLYGFFFLDETLPSRSLLNPARGPDMELLLLPLVLQAPLGSGFTPTDVLCVALV